MLEHLLDPEYTDLDDASVAELIGAQVQTADWLLELGAPTDVPDDAQRAMAREAFAAATIPDADTTLAKNRALMLKTPEEVRHLVGMLTAYDWRYVEQAQELRGYIVAKLLDETKHANPNIRLKALKLLGDVTEVGAFTTRVEVTKHDGDAQAIAERLREKLRSMLDKSNVQDVVEKPGAPT